MDTLVKGTTYSARDLQVQLASPHPIRGSDIGTREIHPYKQQGTSKRCHATPSKKGAMEIIQSLNLAGV